LGSGSKSAITGVDFFLLASATVPTGPSIPPTPTGPIAPPQASPATGSVVPTGSITSPGGISSAPAATVTGPSSPAATGPIQQPTLGQPPRATRPLQVEEFLRLLLGSDLSVEAPVSEAEVLAAIALFSISAVLLAGLGRRRVGNEDKVDVLGMLTLYYGLQDKSLSSRVVVNTQELWRSTVNGGSAVIEDELKSLRDQLDGLGQDVIFLSREARRQFNLGVTNDVSANLTFPALMKRYVEIAADPGLTINLREEDKAGSFTSKDRIALAYDLLSELKFVTLRIVRTLSKHGTIAVERSNREWAHFENRAFGVLRAVGEKRFTEDVDEKRILSVLADLTGKDLNTVIAPYFTLARNGGRLLLLAFDTYLQSKDDLDNFERQELLDLFQKPGNALEFLTTRMRSEALVVRRYPLANWN